MMTRLCRTLPGLLAVLHAFAAVPDPGSDFLLRTRNTCMAFHRSGDTWMLTHYGAPLQNPGDADALAFSPWVGRSMSGHPKAATYTTFGSDNESDRPPRMANMARYGGLSVIHADGVVSTELAGGAPAITAEAPGITHVVFELKDPAYAFHVTQHFRAIEASDVIETWIEIRHEESGPVRLVKMSSAGMVFHAPGDEYSVLSLPGQWGAESQIAESSLASGQTITLGARSGVRSAFGNNPAFMLSLGRHATETSGRVIGGALAWSGAWQISLQRDPTDSILLSAGPDPVSGPYVLEAGRRLVLPKFILTYSDAGRGRVSRNLHRWARTTLLPHGRGPRDVLLNSWEGAFFKFTEKTLTDMMDGVQQLGGEMFVIDDGWFGRGPYARDDDKRGLGDWVVNDAKLPHGLAYLAREANARGLKFGLWIEPEMANTTSALAEAHPEWILREKTRKLRQDRGVTQVVLDLTNPAVRDNLGRQLEAVIGATPGLAYIKWDANADIMNAGSTYLPADRQTNLWYDYTLGVYDLAARLRASHPEIVFQACSSGGGRMEYGFLQFADEFWTSDDTDARQRVFIQWGALQFYPACAMAAHVTAVPNHQTHRTTPLKFRFDVAMSGRLGLELQPKDMTPEEIAFARQAVADYKRIRPVVQQGDLYRLVSPWENNYAALMYVSEDQHRAVVFVYGLNRFIMRDYPPPLRLQGLAPDLTYTVREINRDKAAHIRVDGRKIGGAALQAMGLPIKLDGDYDSAVFELTAE